MQKRQLREKRCLFTGAYSEHFAGPTKKGGTDKLALLFEGAIVTTQIDGNASSAKPQNVVLTNS